MNFVPHPDGLLMAKRFRTPGCCLFCEEALTCIAGYSGQQLICGGYECGRAYQRAYYRDRRRGAPARHLRPPSTSWYCGCRKGPMRRAAFLRHQGACMFALDSFPVVIEIPQRRAAA